MGRARLPTIPGMVPGIDDRPAGCLFNPRCRFATDAVRRRSRRRWHGIAGRRARCHYPLTSGQPTERGWPHDALMQAQRHCAVHYRRRRRCCSAARAWCRRWTACRSRCATGETLAVVGESGCGKSTLARMATLMEPPTAGELLIDGKPTARIRRAWRHQLRLSVQMVFQNPYGSLNPRKTVGAHPGGAAGHQPSRRRARRAQAAARAMMAKVGLRQDQYGRYPHMFSGGQRQRIAIARALMLNPRVVVADEPVSALDVSIQAQVLNLMMDLQDEFRLAYLFISHDLSVVRHIAREVLVMYCGRPVEHGPKQAIFDDAAASVYAHAAGGDAVGRSGASDQGGNREG